MDVLQSTQVFGATTWITLGVSLMVSTAAFVVMRLYVKGILRESQRGASVLAENPRVEDPSRLPTPTTVRPLQIQTDRPTRLAGSAALRSPAFQYAETAFLRAAYVYVIAGSIHAATSVGLLFLFGVYSLPSTPSHWALVVWHLAVFWAWSFFTMIALALFWGPDRRFRRLLVSGYASMLAGMGLLLQLAATPPLPLVDVRLLNNQALLLAIAKIATDATGSLTKPEAVTLSPHLQPILFWSLSGTPILIPLLMFNRLVRGTVGPLFISMALAITELSFVIAGLFVDTSPGLWLLGHMNRLAGRSTFAVLFALSLILAAIVVWRGLLWTAGRYRRKQLSDQTFLFDALWLLVSLWVSVYLMGHDKPFVFLLGLVPFALYKGIVVCGLTPLRKRREAVPDARLLFLRVFGSSHRTEKLFDLLAARWRYAGSVQLISGTDVARGLFEPDEFLDFLNGRLAGAFISSERDLEQRLAALDTRPDPDGRYRVTELFCRADTWKPTVVKLMAQSDLLIMDLRAFTPQRKGCVFELGAMLDRVPLSRAALLIDETTNEPLLRATLADLWERVSPQSPNIDGNARVRIVNLAGGYPAAVRHLMQLGDELTVAASRPPVN